MNFARFLYEKNVIQGDHLLGAMAAHVVSQPPLLSLLIDKQLLSKEQLIAVSLLTLDKQISCVEAMKELDLWQADLVNKLTDQASRDSVSIVQYLLQKGVLSASQLNKAFDEYMAEVAAPAKAGPSTAAPFSSDVAAPSPSTAAIKNIAKSEGLKQRPQEPPHPNATIQSFLELYTAGRHRTLENLAGSLANDSEDQVRNSFVRELEVIKAGAKFIKMTSIVTLAETLAGVVKSPSNKEKFVSQAANAALKKSLANLWLLREAQRQSRTHAPDPKHLAQVANQALSALKSLSPKEVSD